MRRRADDARASQHCPVDPSPVVEEEVDLVELRFRYGDAVVRRSRAPVIWMTQRRRLDAFLLDAARERGVEVREGVTVTIERQRRLAGGERSPPTSSSARTARTGRRRKAFGLGGGIVHGVAYEGNVPYGVVSRERYARRAVIELADIPGGYGWVFPKGDHVERRRRRLAGARGRASASTCARVCEAHGLDPAQLESLRGHRLPLRMPGDAARRRAGAARRRRRAG